LFSVEQVRMMLSKSTESSKKSLLGQFFTPQRTADFMASMFPDGSGKCHLLDAGAGIGSLLSSFLKRWQTGGFSFDEVEIDAYEIDESLHHFIESNLQDFKVKLPLKIVISGDDFVTSASEIVSGSIFANSGDSYTHAILNPPYKKIKSNSTHRLVLRRVGIETVNLYAAFVALAIARSRTGAHIVAIIPRSFCNGPYYKPFREYMLKHTVIRQIHLFGSRKTAFKDDDVLQENVIIHVEKDGVQQCVRITSSTDDTFEDLMLIEHDYEDVVRREDENKIIRIPTSKEKNILDLSPIFEFTLEDLGISVSTGPIVEHRLRNEFRAMPGTSTVPMLYPWHMKNNETKWPIESKKNNAIVNNLTTRKFLYPNGFYCVVRRFSSKEEKRRIVASVIDPSTFGDYEFLGFENHLNIFHDNKNGLDEDMAFGLVAFLNTTFVDRHFRIFNGHTQVNVSDLKLLKYPSRKVISALGSWLKLHKNCSQAALDERMMELIS
jgi:adenine-specific DNA-methyltransferase